MAIMSMYRFNQFLQGRLWSLGRFVLFVTICFRGIFWSGVSRRHLFEQIEFTGIRSFVVIFVAAACVGAMFGIQFGEMLYFYGAASLLGAASTMALVKEIAPVLGAFIVVGKVGSAMTAQIANMRVRQEIDAMKLMSVDPILYIMSPRICAVIIVMPLLFIEFVFVGMGSSFIIGKYIYDVDSAQFFDKLSWLTQPGDVFRGLLKAAVFGAIIATVSCYKGYHVKRHSLGVGQATTSSVVTSLVAIIVMDFFISYLAWASGHIL